MIRITDILDRVAENNPKADLDIIDRAYIFSARVHDGQIRLSGEPYLSHPLEVAGILAEMNLDPVSIAAGLLHDVIEDTHATPEEIEEIFGKEVMHIVAGVTKISKLSFGSTLARQAESLRKMLLAMADDIRVILIKLADRLHNMRTLEFHKGGKRRQIARETLDIYAPIAARLGIYWIKNELENDSFMYLMPDEYARIKNSVSQDREEREQYVEDVKGYLRRTMAEHHLKSEVLGRYKNYYSIYLKMVSQKLAFEDVYDIIAFRIILDSIAQCYEALGIVHSLWKPIDIKFKDYVARPKPNMYQSLHTTVIGPRGERVEIQIRTHEMDFVAKSGIAAHWRYKEGAKMDESIGKRLSWIQDMVENQENFRNPDEFLENVRIDLYPDEVYVFTPQGDVKTLPKGATPVDFAFLIHTEVGNQCTGAKVNGRLVPLNHELETGDTVDIRTSKNHKPSKDWLKFVKTVKARSRIRQWIKVQEKNRSLSLGREMCEKAFRKHRLNFNTLMKSDQMQAAVAQFGFKAMDDLIASVGYGKTTPLQVVRRFIPKTDEEAKAKPRETIFDRLIGKVKKRKPSAGVLVKGLDDILIRFGKCCQPVPGDPIVGYITRGYGVTVHRTNCVNALKMSPERQIDVAWNEEDNESYPVKILIVSYDRVGLLADIATSISKNDANIMSLNTSTKANEMVESYLTLAVADTGHLDRVLASLRKISMVQDVRRLNA
ncbi:MAG: bifunctional (p)ppGpp synthetase/guanosine-3',5'-bis(diphosphate) 3'-pyrophosphohydrolase [Desulfosarcina sp.]|nr:bifunctional (p)ppGpp synthetase/guanosine-3',5'-bis(diphosphate) 3'-pyrophosphohydrolase [Desulfobacterales bacterium]